LYHTRHGQQVEQTEPAPIPQSPSDATAAVHRPSGVEKPVSKHASKAHALVSRAITRPGREFFSEQWQRALAMANIRGNYQRPDEELIRAMNKKYCDTDDTTSTLSAFATLADSNAPLVTPTATRTATSDTTSDTTTIDGAQTTPSAPQETASDQTWPGEQKGMNTLQDKKWTLDHVMNANSWTQKVNKDARLKLLKNDGYDIAPLLRKGVTSPQITDAVLTYIEVRKHRHAIPTPPGSNDSDSEDEPSSAGEGREHSLQTCVPKEAGKVLGVEPEKTFRTPVQLAGQKRKHSHEDDDEPGWHETMPQKSLQDAYTAAKAQRDAAADKGVANTSSCGRGELAHKKARMTTMEEEEMELATEAARLHKTRILRSIFQCSRAARSLPTPVTIVPDSPSLQAPQPIFAPRPPNKPSHIIIPVPFAPGEKPTGADVCICSRAVGSALDEIKDLSTIGPDSEGTFFIRDPNFEDDKKGDTIMDYRGPEPDEFKHYIALYQADEGSTVIEGDARSLKGLMAHLHSGERTYRCVPKFGDILEGDEKMDVLYRTVRWSFSAGTEAKLAWIEKILEDGQDGDGLSVKLGQVGDGNTALV
jgi:hypothetical protein